MKQHTEILTFKSVSLDNDKFRVFYNLHEDGTFSRTAWKKEKFNGKEVWVDTQIFEESSKEEFDSIEPYTN